MGINVRIRNGLCPNPTTGEGGATEGDIRGSFSDIIDVIGVKDLVAGHALVTENSPAAMSVLVAPGVVYIPNADYDELDSNTVKFFEAIITVSTAVTIIANTSGSTRIDLICAKMDTAITPDEHASNIATLVAVAGTPGAGAPTLPDNHALLAEVEVADSATTIINANITDSRTQAKINSKYLTVTADSTTTFTNKSMDYTANTFTNFPTSSSNLAQQAIINGNFDVWQRGTSATNVSNYSTADRWQTYRAGLQTGMSTSQQDGTGVAGSVYSLRIQRANGNSATDDMVLAYNMETVDSVKFRGKKVTLSFWAKCGANYSPTSSILVTKIKTGTGTDESERGGLTGSADVAIENKTLTTSWQKFTLTTTNVLAATVNQLAIKFSNTPTGTAGANDWLEITQFQLCAGDVALPFMPKSYEEELRACQRYYEKSFEYETTPANIAYNVAGNFSFGGGKDGAQQTGTIFYKVKKRIIPTITTYSSNANATGLINMCYNAIDLGITATPATNGFLDMVGQSSFMFGTILTGTYDSLSFAWTADAEL